MENERIVNNCVVKEEVDLTPEDERGLKEEEREDEEDIEEEEEDEDDDDIEFLEENFDQNENNVTPNPVEFINFAANTDKSVPTQEFISHDPLPSDIKSGCQIGKCKLKCWQISHDIKMAIFQHFWHTLNLDEKLEFISCHICIAASVNQTRRNYFFKINQRLRKVCCKTFVDTLNINRSWILTALKKFNRTPNDSMSHFMSTVYRQFSDKGKEVRFNLANRESENLQIENVDLVQCSTQPAEELPLRLIDAKSLNELQSNDSTENNSEFETVFLDNDANSACRNSKTTTPQEMKKTNSAEINEIVCENIVELSDDDSNSNINNGDKISDSVDQPISSKTPCRACYACIFPKEQRKNVSHIFWKVKTYSEKIHYLANHIKVVEKVEKEGKCEYICAFFLSFNSIESNVCEYGFQNVLSVSDDWLTAAMMKALEKFSSKTIVEKINHLPPSISANKIVLDKTNNEFDEQLTNLWNKAKRLKCHFQTITKQQIEKSNNTLLCDNGCELFCQMSKTQWTLNSNEFWGIETISELRKYILNHIQFFSLTNKPCRKYFLKIDGKLRKVCRSFFLETLSIKNEIIEAVGKEVNAEFKNSIENQMISSQSSLMIEALENSLVGQKVQIPCDAFYHHRCRQILEEQRQQIFRTFWLLNSNLDRYRYILKFVNIKARTSENNYNLIYFLDVDGKRERVCQAMFEATLDINDKWIQTALKKLEQLSNIDEKKTINFTLKRPLTPDVILTNVKKIAHSQPNSTMKINAKADDSEIVAVSSDIIDDSVEKKVDETASPRFEMVTVTELKKEIEEPLEAESTESVERMEPEIENETGTKESLEIDSEEPMETVSEDEIIEINLEEEEIKEDEDEMNLEPMETSIPTQIMPEEKEVIEINSEEETEEKECPVGSKKKNLSHRTIGIFSHRKGKFCNIKCENRCYLTNNRRQDIFNYFWNIGSRYHKFEFLSKHVDVMPVNIASVVKKKIISMNLKYFLKINEERIMVCRETFLSVLGINMDWIHNVLNYFGRNLDNLSSRQRVRLNSLHSRQICVTEVDSAVAFEAGLPYVTSKGTNLPGRKLRKSCVNCQFACKEFSHRQREEIFHNFWNISSRRRKYDFLWDHIKKICIDMRNIYNVRQFFLELNGEMKEVCPTMFTATLDIDIVWVQKLEELRKSVTD